MTFYVTVKKGIDHAEQWSELYDSRGPEGNVLSFDMAQRQALAEWLNANPVRAVSICEVVENNRKVLVAWCEERE